MLIFLIAKHLMWSRHNADGGTSFYYYYDEITWVVGAIALVWVTWFLVRSYRRARALKRRPRTNHRLLKRIVRIKQELSSSFLQPGFSGNIHAVGIGKIGDAFCIQVFVQDPNQEIRAGSGRTTLAQSYRGVPLVLIEMPRAGFLSDTTASSAVEPAQYPNGIREQQELIVGGISGANANLAGQSGTIGYFCTRKSKLPRRKETHLLSNSHVFADLAKAKIDDGDLIMQPSPGEPTNNRPIASLVHFSPLLFDGDLSEPNHVDAAVAKLWAAHSHKPVIPLIGAVEGYVEKKDIEIGETARKFGRTTGYTEGQIFSIYLDIWIRYDRTGQSAFFQNQLLIEPALPKFTKFVAKGDSGSLVVDGKQHAIGLIFGGMAEMPESLIDSAKVESSSGQAASSAGELKRIESYGVANPISEVLQRLKIDLLV
ncbi:MAG TPA: hypothetical protein VGO73_04920 [Pyrinomonadaceae bacterium]|jgi:hypothetical protein|nr:hypothetical protein [Pyrinomonadaceae bacterium]